MTTTDPYAEAVGAGSVGLVEWLAAPAEVQGLTPADWLQARKMSEAVVAAAVGPLLAPVRALASGPTEPGYQPYAADICGEVRFVVLLDDLRAALDAIEAGATSEGGQS